MEKLDNESTIAVDNERKPMALRGSEKGGNNIIYNLKDKWELAKGSHGVREEANHTSILHMYFKIQ